RILFVFHKNDRLSCKAKVQPPRLNGAKTGVFSTRSPHRPNAIGLTLARLEKVEASVSLVSKGGTLYLSGIDMIQGTPVLDIKPYISEYDSPQPALSSVKGLQENEKQYDAKVDLGFAMSERDNESDRLDKRLVQPPIENSLNIDKETSAYLSKRCGFHGEMYRDPEQMASLKMIDGPSAPGGLEDATQDDSSCQAIAAITAERQRSKSNRQEVTSPNGNEDQHKEQNNSADSCVPSWVRDAPVVSLKVRFTPHAEMELRQFKAPCDSVEPSFRYFQSPQEAKCAITTVLSADPRSVYRRKQCQDRLFYFSLDTIHITCWFGNGFAEVLQIKHLEGHSM
ncbi:hypothetical protein FKM82_030414, partial [Ascaphus truei]